MVQPRDPVGRRRTALGLPRVEAQVVVVTAGGQEQDVAGRAPARHVARLGDHVEPEHADVEVADPVDVGRAQVGVADPHARVDRVGRLCDRGDAALCGPGMTRNGVMVRRHPVGSRPVPCASC